MTQKATQGKWVAKYDHALGNRYITSETQIPGATQFETICEMVGDNAKADAELIVACVNLLKDIPLSELQALKPERVRASNELYEALKQTLQLPYPTRHHNDCYGEVKPHPDCETCKAINIRRNAIKALRKAEGG